MSTKKGSAQKTKTVVDPPVQLPIWDILEHPIFEEKLTAEMQLLKHIGENYDSLKKQVEEQYKRDLETLEMAKDPQLKELLKDFPKPDDFTVKYVEVFTKKSRLSHHKREVIEKIFSQLVKSTAIDIINSKKEKDSCAESSSPEDQSKLTS